MQNPLCPTYTTCQSCLSAPVPPTTDGSTQYCRYKAGGFSSGNICEPSGWVSWQGATYDTSCPTLASVSFTNLSPSTYSSSITSYSVSVPSSFTSFTFTPSFSAGSLTYAFNNGASVSLSSSTPSASLTPNTNANTLSITYTRDSTATVTYVYTITKGMCTMHVHIHTYIHTYIYTYMHKCVCEYMHAHTYAHAHTHAHISM